MQKNGSTKAVQNIKKINRVFVARFNLFYFAADKIIISGRNKTKIK
jgi:hypothetical protein